MGREAMKPKGPRGQVRLEMDLEKKEQEKESEAPKFSRMKRQK